MVEHSAVISNGCSHAPACDGTCAGRSKLCMHLTFRWGELLRAECWRYEAQIKAIHILPEDAQTPPAWLTLTVTLMICYATIVAFGLLRAFDL